MAVNYRTVQALRLTAIDRVTDTYALKLKKVADDLARRMNVLLGRVSAGEAVNAGSLTDAALARAQVTKLLVDSGFYRVTGDLLSSGFQDILDTNLEIYNRYYGAGLRFEDVSGARIEAIRSMQSQVFQDLAGEQATNLQRILTNLSFGTSSIESASGALANVLDDLSSYAETIVRTSVHAFERESNLEMATAAGIEMYVYIGPDDKLTREFCQKWLGVVQPIEDWQNIINEDDPMGPITVYGGGHNCRHELVPYTGE